MTQLDFNVMEQSLKHIWHPCSQMKDYEMVLPLEVIGAQGAHVKLKNGKEILDAISSWWCKSLGHQHPRLKQALNRQLEQFEHVILANTTNATIATLSKKLAQLTENLSRAFYASDGSSAIEIAMKMSLHARQLTKEHNRNKFVALENGYHGETVGALSVSDIGVYRDPYRALLFDVHFLAPLPYVETTADPLWEDCSSYWANIEKQLNPLSKTMTAIILEPIVQGAGGMKIYSQDFLKRLRLWTEEHGIHLIADEIMTGIGRTGKMLACEHAKIEPDFLCLSKGLTSGWLPLSVVLTRESIYELFYADYAAGKAFLHSHTYSGNALAASVAIEVLQVMADEHLLAHVAVVQERMHAHMLAIAEETGKIKHVRSLGAMTAADLVHAWPSRQAALEFVKRAADAGALLRPLGNTLYWLPPLNVDGSALDDLKNITQHALCS